jgi:hypothetical protein
LVGNGSYGAHRNARALHSFCNRGEGTLS